MSSQFLLNKSSKFLPFVWLLVSFSAWANQPCTSVIKKGDYEHALSICTQELKAKQGDDIEVLLALVEIHHELGNQKQEAELLEQIRYNPKFLENTEYQYQWYRRVGQQYYFLANYLQAQVYLDKGLAVAIQTSQPIWQSKSHNDVGLVAYKLKDYATALTHFKLSLELKQKHGNAYQVGKTLNNIALVHMDLEEHNLAIDYYEQALEQYLSYVNQEAFDERVFLQIAHIYEDLTQAHTADKDVAAAQDYAAKIVDTFKLKSSPKAQARALMNLGNHHAGLKQYSKAKLFYDEARRIYEAHGYSFSASNLHDVAVIEYHQGFIKAANSFAQRGLVLAKNNKDHRLSSEFYALLSEIHQPTDPVAALTFMTEHIASREQFLQEKYDQDLSTIKHEVEKQQIQHDLINEQLINAQKSVKLQRLTNGVLIIAMVFLMLLGTFIVYMINKRRERQALLKSIKHHEQQLFLMQHQPLNLHDAEPAQSDSDLKQALKVELVGTMIDALSIWEKTTGKDRIELAECSKVWTISIDNGTLRTRSLDKYLDIEKIPQNPRWRNVVKTCHFILAHEQLATEDRTLMEHKLSTLLDQVKSLSLGVNV